VLEKLRIAWLDGAIASEVDEAVLRQQLIDELCNDYP
jgi:hypothetical protein